VNGLPRKLRKEKVKHAMYSMVDLFMDKLQVLVKNFKRPTPRHKTSANPETMLRGQEAVTWQKGLFHLKEHIRLCIPTYYQLGCRLGEAMATRRKTISQKHHFLEIKRFLKLLVLRLRSIIRSHKRPRKNSGFPFLSDPNYICTTAFTPELFHYFSLHHNLAVLKFLQDSTSRLWSSDHSGFGPFSWGLLKFCTSNPFLSTKPLGGTAVFPLPSEVEKDIYSTNTTTK
jgi:hypothetical protein